MRALSTQRLAVRVADRRSGRGAAQRESLRHREETFRTRLNEELQTQVRQARREIDDVIAKLKSKTAAMSTPEGVRLLSTGETGAARSDARAAVDQVVHRFLEPVEARPAESPAAGSAKVGDRVVISGLGLEGVVTSLHDGTADLDVRGKRMRASLDGSADRRAAPRRRRPRASTCGCS